MKCVRVNSCNRVQSAITINRRRYFYGAGIGVSVVVFAVAAERAVVFIGYTDGFIGGRRDFIIDSVDLEVVGGGGEGGECGEERA